MNYSSLFSKTNKEIYDSLPKLEKDKYNSLSIFIKTIYINDNHLSETAPLLIKDINNFITFLTNNPSSLTDENNLLADIIHRQEMLSEEEQFENFINYLVIKEYLIIQKNSSLSSPKNLK